MARSVISRLKVRFAALALAIAVALLPGARFNSTPVAKGASIPTFESAGASASVLYQSDVGIGCRDATTFEADTLSLSRSAETLSVISPVQTEATTGLTIMLRATQQLESNPQAKAAFVRVAALYQSMITTPITVVIDVDFGPTWFGQGYPEGIVGLTNPQLLVGSPIYTLMQEHLIDGASNNQERDLYHALPQILVPTDISDTNTVVGPSALFRALDFISPIAAPEIEPGIWGPPPAIGFNSVVPYDFDPTDGVDPGKEDFEAAVAHEMGHVLGFVSYTGALEIDATRTCALSVWDLFRFRPGVNMSTFSTAERILSSGGNQVFFAGGAEYGLSTGRPDGSGGDGKQASHWRDDVFTGDRIGIMDPSIPMGKRQTITFKDLAALDVFGYTLKPVGNTKPVISDLVADLDGDVLHLRATLTDIDGDPARVQLRLIDDDNQVISQLAPTIEDFGIATKTLWEREFPGISSVPMVTKVGLIVTDSRGNNSAMVVADFSGGDPGGPKLSTASYNKGRLNIKGKKFGSDLRIEVNGQTVAPTSVIGIGGSAKKLVIEADSALLNLRTGPNRLRVISNGLRSNLLVMDFE